MSLLTGNGQIEYPVEAVGAVSRIGAPTSAIAPRYRLYSSPRISRFVFPRCLAVRILPTLRIIHAYVIAMRTKFEAYQRNRHVNSCPFIIRESFILNLWRFCEQVNHINLPYTRVLLASLTMNNGTFDTRKSMDRRKGLEYLLSKAFVPISQLINTDRESACVERDAYQQAQFFSAVNVMQCRGPPTVR